QPIILRTGRVHKPGGVGDDAATATETKPKRRRKSKVKMQELFPSRYLRAADLQGNPRTVVINHVTHEDFKDDGITVKKTILHFNGSGTAPVVVNKTNWKMLVGLPAPTMTKTGPAPRSNCVRKRCRARAARLWTAFAFTKHRSPKSRRLSRRRRRRRP